MGHRMHNNTVTLLNFSQNRPNENSVKMEKNPTRSVKRFRTLIARVWSFVRVSNDVTTQLGRRGKSFWTVWTAMRSFAGMYISMRLQGDGG